MSDLEALYIFLNKPISSEMVRYLVATTTSIISVQPVNEVETSAGLATPPHSPTKDNSPIPSLHTFIEKLINYSHVQCTTLMTTLVYLNRLKEVIPPNSIGMATTHHRIFLGSMLLAAKYTNDSSPMNKHWTGYTDGLLSLREVNALEIEMIQYIGWDHLRFQNEDLIYCLSYFLEPIKRKLRLRNETKIQNSISQLKYSNSQLNLNTQLSSFPQSLTSSSLPSLMSSSSSTSTVSSYMTNSLPRKDSVQSIESTVSSVSNSPALAQPSKPSEKLSLPLRPLRLKPKNPHSIPNNDNEQSSTSKTLPRRRSSINLLPIQTPPTTLTLKHSRKSVRLTNLSLDEKENYPTLDTSVNVAVN